MRKIKAFFHGVLQELKRVRWPKKKEMYKFSFVTIGFMVFFGSFFYVSNILFALIKSMFN